MYHFVTPDGPQSQQTGRAKFESQKYLYAARQHVMRGVYSAKSRKRTTAVENIEASKDKISDQPSRRKHATVVRCKPWSMCKHTCHSPLQKSVVNSCTFAEDVVHHIPTSIPGLSQLGPFLQWPVALTSRMQYLLHYLLSTNCQSIRPLRSACWPLINLDQGILYHTLAISAFCLSARTLSDRKDAITSEGLFYYTKGLNSVNSRLRNGSHGWDEGLIVSIMGIAVHTLTRSTLHGWCWELTQSSPRRSDGIDEWLLHFRALKTIIDRRGGAAHLDSNHVLRLWLFAMDVEGAVTRDLQPLFPLPLRHLPSITSSRSITNATVLACISTWAMHFPDEHAVIDIFKDLGALTTWLSEQLSSHGAIFWTRPDRAMGYLMALIHRCLQLSSRSAFNHGLVEEKQLDPCPEAKAFENALRYAIILFLAPVRRLFGSPSGGTELHIVRLAQALNLCLNGNTAPQLKHLLFWILVVGGLEAHTVGVCTTWYTARLAEYCAAVGATQHRQVLMMVEGIKSHFWWIKEVFDPCSAELADSIAMFLDVGELSEPHCDDRLTP